MIAIAVDDEVLMLGALIATIKASPDIAELYSINPAKMDCDYFSYLKTGKPDFGGEYMTQYSWAEGTCGLPWDRKIK